MKRKLTEDVKETVREFHGRYLFLPGNPVYYSSHVFLFPTIGDAENFSTEVGLDPGRVEPNTLYGSVNEYPYKLVLAYREMQP